MEEKETVREPYRMVLEGGQAELVEKKSRFIANVPSLGFSTLFFES